MGADNPDTPPKVWVDENGNSWRLRQYGPGPRTRRQFLDPSVRIMLWSYSAPRRDVDPDERHALWDRVVRDDADEASPSTPERCGLVMLYIYTDGKGHNVLIVGEPRW